MLRSGPYGYHLAALFCVTVWGATFVSTKVLIAHGLAPAEIFLLRFAMAYLGLLPFTLRRRRAGSSAAGQEKAAAGREKDAAGREKGTGNDTGSPALRGLVDRLRGVRLRRARLRDELLLAAAGLTGGSFYFLTENIALEYAPASNVSLIVCTAPVWTALLLSLVYRSERMTRRQTAGCALAFVGVVLVVLNGRFVLHLSPRGDLLALSAALLWMLYSLVIKRLGDRLPVAYITRKVFFYGIVTILPWFAWEPFDLPAATLRHPAVWGNLLFLGVVASLLCYVLWNAAMTRLGAVRTTNYIYLNPLVTMLTAALVIDERITPAALCGAALILSGMWLAERSRGGKYATRCRLCAEEAGKGSVFAIFSYLWGNIPNNP